MVVGRGKDLLACYVYLGRDRSDPSTRTSGQVSGMKPLVLAIAVLGAASWGCAARQRALDVPMRPLLNLTYSSGGPAPVVEQAIVYVDGRVEYRERGRSTLVARLAGTQVSRIQNAISSPRLLEVIHRAAIAWAAAPRDDWRTYSIEVENTEATMAAEDAPMEIRDLIRDVDRVLRREFGGRYRELFRN